MIRRFSSLTALHAEAERQGVFQERRRQSASWYGDETVDQTASRTLVGDRTLVRDAELLMNKLDSRIEVRSAASSMSLTSVRPLPSCATSFQVASSTRQS
jgi:hypothetical protein